MCNANLLEIMRWEGCRTVSCETSDASTFKMIGFDKRLKDGNNDFSTAFILVKK